MVLQILFSSFVFAEVDSGIQSPRNSSVERLQSPIKFTSVTEVLNGFFKVLIELGAVAVVLAIVYAGFLFVAARGNPEQLTKARTTLFWTIIGALILLGAQVIAGAVQHTITSLGK